MRAEGDEREIRVFISSPSDVGAERARASAALKELSAEFAGRFRFVPIRWEETYYSAHQTFQDAIPKPSSCQLVICILWKRLGTELPPDYNRPDGTTRTGTEYEFEEALEAALRHETPDILVYRKRVLIDADRFGQDASELSALNTFWHRWFNDDQGNFTASFDRFDTEDEFHDKLKRSVRLWLGRLSQEVTWSVAQLGSPFRSLEPFEAGHARVFFGRRRAIRRVVSKLAAASARGCSFLVVLGGSGTGKSSLVRAGVVPSLTIDRALPEAASWRVATVRPAALGDDLLRGLAEALFQPAALPELEQGAASAPDRLAALMRTAPGEAANAISAALRDLPATEGTTRLVLLVDQLEELLLRSADLREELIAVLDALARCGLVWVIATLRNDRYGEFQASPGLVRLKADGDSFDLPPPGPAEIREIIEGPARAAGLRFEETEGRSLASLLEAAAQERGALPLLQFTLQCLFIERDAASGTLLLSVYDRLGGLAGAIAGEAERLVAGLPETVRSALPGLLLKLVEIEDGKDAASARTLDRSDLADPVQRALAARMIEGRLLTVDGTGESARLRLAHEALLARWPLLADLVGGHRDFLAVRRRIDTDAASWIAEGRHADFLLPPGRRLAEAADALVGGRSELGQSAIELIEASLVAERERVAAETEARRRELEERAEAAEAREQVARRLFKRTRTAAIIVSVLLVAMLATAGLWLSQRVVAQRQAAEAEQSYATALKGASENLAIVQKAAGAGRMTMPVKQGMLKITREAFENLPSERETPEATETRARLLISLESANLDQPAELGRKSVALARSLVARDPTNANWQELLQETLWHLGNRLVMGGNLADAAKQLAEAEAIAAQVSAAQPDDGTWRFRLAADQRASAGVMQRRGDLAGALARYQASEDRIGAGDVLLARGDLAAAGDAYRTNLKTVTEYAMRTGANANANIDSALALARTKVGDVLRMQGDIDGSLKEYQAAVTLLDRLFQNGLGSFDSVHTMYAASRGTGDIALAKGDVAGALTQYQKVAAQVADRVKSFPDAPDWMAELAEIDARIGDVRIAQGDFAAAESQYRTALTEAETASHAVGDDAGWQRDIELTHGRLAGALRGKGDLDAAAAEYRTQIDLAGRLVKLDATNADWQRDLALGWAGLGTTSLARHDGDTAAAAFAQCLAVPVASHSDPLDELGHDPHEACRSAKAP